MPPLFISLIVFVVLVRPPSHVILYYKYDRTYNSSTNEIFLKSYIALN